MTKQSRAYRWVKSGVRGGSLALAAQCLLFVAACSSDDTSPIGPDDEETDVTADESSTADETGTEDEEAPTDDDDDKVAPPAIDAGGGKRDAGPTPPKADGGGTTVTPPKTDGGGTTGGLDGGVTDPGPSEPGPTEPSGSPCLDDATDYGPKGKFSVMQKTSGSVKMWVPGVPAGCKVPVIHLANGTGGTCGTYGAALTTLASHGFLAVCFENTNTGAGTQGITAFDTALKEFPDLADKKFGSTGHSQGGQAAFVVLQFAEEKYGPEATYAGLAIEPASGFGSQPAGGSWQSIYAKIKSPMFMFSGTSDTLVSEGWVKRGFDALDDGIEAYNWSARGATHVPVPNKETQQISVPWFRWKLLGDKKACAAFKALNGGGTWTQRDVQNEKTCD